MPRFIPIVIEINDSKATPRVKGLKNALDGLDDGGNKAGRGLRNVFDSVKQGGTTSVKTVVDSIKQIGPASLKAADETKSGFQQIEQHAETTAKGSASAFSQYFSAAFLASLLQRMLATFVTFSKEFVAKSVELAQDMKTALLGVESVSLFKGIDPQEAKAAIGNLQLVKAGIISMADASIALKNLLASGFGLQQSITLIERFGDTAAFGKQAALSYGEAIRSATEGIKNQNSILVDNAGISKNIEVILKERGFTTQDLSDKVKGLAAREALYNGILAESQGQLGDAAKLTATYTGVVAAQDKAYQDLQRTLGEIIITNPALIESNKLVTEQLDEATAAIKRQDSESAKFVRNAIYYYAQIKANIAPFGAFMVHMAKAVYHALGIAHTAFWGTITAATESLMLGFRKSIEVALNLIISAVNKITDIARKLPGDLGGPITLLQAIGPIAPVALGSQKLSATEIFLKDFLNHWEGLKRADLGMYRAAEEGREARRRVRVAEADAAYMASLGSDASLRANARLDRANELANQQGGGKAKKAVDDFKSIANVIPVPTPSDPQLKAMIEEYAATFGIPTWVAFAQIWNESRFNKNALSPKGAKGLTQIMPGTAAQYGISYKNLNDPQVALSGWGKIMSSLYAKYGSWDLALLAYHQGEKPVDRLVTIIQSGQVDESAGGFAAAAKRAGIGPLGRKYLADINLFKSNPLPQEESPFLGMPPQQIVKTVLTTDAAGNARPIPTDEAPALAQLPVALERQWNNYYESAEQGAQALADRRQDLDAEYLSNFKHLVTEVGNLELDLALLRRENVDDQLTEQRRLLLAKSEEKDLLLSIRQVQDEIANGPYNESLRIQLALLQDIADIRRRDEEAIKAQNRAQLELADAGVFHAEQARAIVLDHLAQSRSQTEIFADGIIEAYDSINEVVLSGVQRLTGGIKILDQIIAGLITRITNRLFQKLLDVLIPSGSGGNGAGAFGGSPGGGGFMNVLGGIFGNLFNRRGGGFSTGGFAGGPGAAQLLGLGGGITNPQQAQAAALGNIFNGSTLTAPATLTGQLAQQAALSGAIQQAGVGGAAVGGIGAAAGGALAPSAAAGFLPMIGAALPFLGAGVGTGVGGGSRLGQILGGAGGLIAGGIGAAFLAPSLFATTGLLGSFGPAIAGLLTNPFTAIAAGALLVGAFALRRNAARRRDEVSRTATINDSLGQLNQILSSVKSDRMDGGQAIAAAVQIRSQYVSTVSQLKDKKTREIALKDVSRLDLVIGQIRAEAERQLKRKEVDERLVPEFASGGVFKSDYFIPQQARSLTELPRAGLGLYELPGTFDRRDDLLMRVSSGESVAVMTPQQYARIGGRKTFEAAGVPAFASGGFSAAGPVASDDDKSPIVFNVNLDIPGLDPGLIVEQGMKDPRGYEASVRVWNKAKRAGRGNVR